MILKCSTIAVAEYCIKGKHTELPLRNVQILPFNFSHALRAGELSSIWISHRNESKFPERAVVINDIKLMAQADDDTLIDAYITSDVESKKIYDFLKEYTQLSFAFIDLKIPYNEIFGILPLEQNDRIIS